MEKKKKITPEYIMKCEVAKEIGLWDRKIRLEKSYFEGKWQIRWRDS